MAIKVGINGFGRIGRNVYRAAMNNKNIEIVAVNDLTDAKTLAHLLKYDSVLGNLHADVKAGENAVIVNGKEIKVFAQRDPAMIPWGSVGVEYVVESTGHFTDKAKAVAHLKDTVKKVIISAPATGEDLTIVLGVNEDKYDRKNHHVVSNASCTTNCLAPFAKVLHDKFGIVKGLMTTIHSFTNDQVTLDFPHKDLRRARAASLNMIPTSTGAAKAIGLVMPELKGKLDGLSIRVPTPVVSVVDLVVELSKTVTKEEINDTLREAAKSAKLNKYLEVTDEPLVSADFKGNPHSSIVDALSTYVTGGNMVKVLSWYDNEWGYSNRVVDLIEYMVSKG
ncbi:MAG TPA: type I glyceraldehyde-3-phosphate dehydrogenase [bacterium]|jgi:glyceraldehyde 3-phosphate dehydrogenase|nr:type I glyceraldehyde-3-phosphate dehydrogenase [bacterium]